MLLLPLAASLRSQERVCRAAPAGSVAVVWQLLLSGFGWASCSACSVLRFLFSAYLVFVPDGAPAISRWLACGTPCSCRAPAAGYKVCALSIGQLSSVQPDMCSVCLSLQVSRSFRLLCLFFVSLLCGLLCLAPCGPCAWSVLAVPRKKYGRLVKG